MSSIKGTAYEQHHIASVNVNECEKYLKLETELLNKKDFIEKEIYDKLVSKLIAENEHLKQTYKQLYDSIKPTRIRSKEQCDDLINQVNLKYVEISDLNASLQEKVLEITALKDDLRKLKGKALVDNAVTKHTIDPEMLKIDVEPITPKLLNKRTAHFAYIKHTQEKAVVLRDLVDHVKANYPLDHSLEYAFRSKTYSKINANFELKCVKCNGCMLSDNHDLCVLDFINNVNAHNKSKYVKKSSKRKVWKTTGKVFTNIRYIWRPTGRTFTIVGNAYPLTRTTTTTEVPLRKTTALENETPTPVVTLVYSRKFRKSQTNVPVSKPKVIKSVSANKKEPSKSWGSIVSNVPSSSLDECRSSKLFSARHGLVRGLPKLKFEKDHLCSACAMGKSKKKPHKPKSEDTDQEKLYLLHMDLCGPMRVTSVNGKKYILIIVDDYSRFIWIKCLRSKDEALDFIIKFLKMIQVRLKVPVRRIRTDNGTEFVNQTLCEYYEKVGISHETSVARSPQQNGVVERRNRTTRAKPPPSTPFVPPSRTNWDLLFQPLFDELLTPPPSVGHPAPEVIAPIIDVVAPVPAVSTSSPSLTNVDQDAPSLSNSQTTPETQPPIIPNDVEEDNYDIEVAHMGNDPPGAPGVIVIPSLSSSVSVKEIYAGKAHKEDLPLDAVNQKDETTNGLGMDAASQGRIPKNLFDRVSQLRLPFSNRSVSK
ncbi:retrovirus-related pol polyprotein from transposon TNT 1-94 [Tanacetum coccineum]